MIRTNIQRSPQHAHDPQQGGSPKPHRRPKRSGWNPPQASLTECWYPRAKRRDRSEKKSPADSTIDEGGRGQRLIIPRWKHMNAFSTARVLDYCRPVMYPSRPDFSSTLIGVRKNLTCPIYRLSNSSRVRVCPDTPRPEEGL